MSLLARNALVLGSERRITRRWEQVAAKIRWTYKRQQRRISITQSNVSKENAIRKRKQLRQV